MSERNYENLYWEAQGHIDKLEGENAELKQRETDLELIIKQLGRGAGGLIPECVLADTQEKTS